MSRFRYLFLYSGGLFFELASLIVIFVVVGVLVNYFVFSITPIKGQSMEPNFHSGDWALVDKVSYLKYLPKRGDVVGLRFPGDPNNEKYIKRVIGLPGEKLEIIDGRVHINGEEINEDYLPQDTITISDEVNITLREDQYYLIGDNRSNSSDSRIWGPASKNEFIGKVRFILYPISDYKYIDSPGY